MLKRPLVYTALGDSLTEGLGVRLEDSFAQVYRALMEEKLGQEVVLHQGGVSGETTCDILRRLELDERLRQAVWEADLISLTAGGNDLLHAAREFLAKRDPQVLKAALRDFSRNTGKIIDTINRIRIEQEDGVYQDKPLVMRILNLYNPFPIIEETVYWVGRFNKEWLAYESPFIRIVDIHEAFQYRIDELIGDDMVHPNTHGYRVMAETADALGYEGIGSDA